MLNMKKALIVTAALTALCASAFAASADDTQKAPTMRERVNCILAEGRTDCPPAHMGGPRHPGFHNGMKKMSPEQRAEMEKRRAEWEKMTPEQRQEAHAKWQKERQQHHEKRAKEAMSKLTPEQRAEVEAFIKEDREQRQARHAKLQKMTPEQRAAVFANRPMPPKMGRHHKHFHR